LLPIIDRFEGDWAVIEYGRATFNFPRALLPKEAREGDVLRFHVQVDVDTTRRRRQRIRALEDELFRRE